MSVSDLATEGVVSQQASAGSNHAVARALRALWFGVIPLLLTCVTWRYLLPRPTALPDGALRDWAEFCDQHLTWVWPGLFLFYSYVCRHFRAHLPGALHWSEPPLPSQPSVLSHATWLALVAIAAGTALLARTSLFQTYRVLSASMLPSLQPNDLLLASRSAY